MHFWHKVATEEASEHSTYDSLLTQKNGQKCFLSKNGRIWLGRNFWAPKIDHFGVGWMIYFQPTPKGFQSPRKKFFMLTEPFWDSVGPPESKTAKIRPKNAILQKFLHPFGAGRSKIFSPSPKKYLVIPNSLLGSIGLWESKNRWF